MIIVAVRAQISSPRNLDIVSFCLCLLIGDYMIPLSVCDIVYGQWSLRCSSVQKLCLIQEGAVESVETS